MKRLCPVCFAELPAQANYCPICGKCMRDTVEQISQYIGEAPITTVVKIKDCAIRIGMKKQEGEQMKLRKIIGWILVFTPVVLTTVGLRCLPTEVSVRLMQILAVFGLISVNFTGTCLVSNELPIKIIIEKGDSDAGGGTK